MIITDYANYVLQWNGNKQILGQANNPVNTHGYAYGLLPMIGGESVEDAAHLKPPSDESRRSEPNSLESSVDDLGKLFISDLDIDPRTTEMKSEQPKFSPLSSPPGSPPDTTPPASPLSPRSPMYREKSSKSKRKFRSRKPKRDSSHEFLTRNFDRFHEAFADEDFHLFFDYVAFWITWYEFGDMAIEIWLDSVGRRDVEPVKGQLRWQYVAGFIDSVHKGEGGTQALLGKFASGLKGLLDREGARSVLTKGEEISGVKVEEI
ncbi:hypothetical protein HBI46_082010 [Parastagonospora nodorum]|nr:hypothetical protein HBI46_082010 [Parastagonospora nodorum]KAH5469774.1 hypothetical protein HBI28_169540 [Parastagonospora nodorum]KAH5622188.1 hypothetical protein HBI22_187350 [Parastagonospora nodorum]KAH5700813.1 hypothetical protein HBI44_052140 [Parastagonospora nodorum]KAH6332010.1 hypothetical protein HBI37_176560 [Parastagonospora nodorum]